MFPDYVALEITDLLTGFVDVQQCVDVTDICTFYSIHGIICQLSSEDDRPKTRKFGSSPEVHVADTDLACILAPG